MKKIIIIEILLLFVFCFAIAVAIRFWENVVICTNEINSFQKIYNPDNFATFDGTLQALKEGLNKSLAYAITASFAAIADLAAIVIITIKDLPTIKLTVNELKAKFTTRKEQRVATKAEQAATAKQERIEKLQAELDELKKDE